MTANTFVRPAWTPVTIAMMIIGFMIYWPLGLAMIAYIVWGDRLDGMKDDLNRATDKVSETFKSTTSASRTGNAAFDEWREVELTRLEEERQKLNESVREFEEYQRELRRAKDADEFETFMKSRKRKAPPRSRKSDK